jgi:hypothetical protein
MNEKRIKFHNFLKVRKMNTEVFQANRIHRVRSIVPQQVPIVRFVPSSPPQQRRQGPQPRPRGQKEQRFWQT